jgi:hypothetical protein
MVLDLGRQPWGNHFVPIDQYFVVPKYPLELFFCRDCSMVQIGHTIPKEIMFVHHGYLSGTTRALRGHFLEVKDDILKRVKFESGDYILDIGGNDGTFLMPFARDGIPCLNVESGVRQAQFSNENRIPCLNKFFNDELAAEILRERGAAKAIHGSGIFFHLEELHSVFRGIKRLLHPEGVLVAQFIYLPQMVDQVAYDQIYHEHLLYYRLGSFDRLLSAYGLGVADARLASIHGGSCIAFIGHRERVAPSAAVRALLDAEEARRFHEVGVYKAFGDKAVASRDALLRMVQRLRAQGKRIQLLGAPVKGSTIVNFCGLTEKEIECAVEINPLKCQTYFPGTRIPVYHQNKVVPPDVYVLLAWNFKDEILAKLDDFRSKGQVLVPVPEPILI